MPNRGMSVVVERTIVDIKKCVERFESLRMAALDLIEEMPEDKVGDNLETNMAELKQLSDNIPKFPRYPEESKTGGEEVKQRWVEMQIPE